MKTPTANMVVEYLLIFPLVINIPLYNQECCLSRLGKKRQPEQMLAKCKQSPSRRVIPMKRCGELSTPMLSSSNQL